MPPASTRSVASTRGGKALMISRICAILVLHWLLFVYTTKYYATNEFYLHTLLLLILPILVGSFQNLKQYQRWALYYTIWFQLMVDSWTQGIYDIDYVNFDLFIFIHMEGIFYTHLMAITDGQPIPRSVYYSSWVSNTKLESYIAAHRSEENDDNENGSDEKQPASTTSATTTTTTSRSTTTATIKAKLGYLLATTVLLITVYQEIETKYMDYICYYSSDSLDPYFVPTADDLTPNPNYPAYCFSTLSTFETTLLQHFPSLDNYLYSFYRISFTRLSALCFALAWSTIPTTVVVTAWIQMWNSLSSSHKIRKVHYVVFMYPLKMAALGLVMYYTLDRREYVESADYMGSSSDGVRAKYLLVWFVLFRAATKLAFGLGLIWNLYVVHSKDATADRIHHSHQEEKEMEQVV